MAVSHRWVCLCVVLFLAVGRLNALTSQVTGTFYAPAEYIYKSVTVTIDANVAWSVNAQGLNVATVTVVQTQTVADTNNTTAGWAKLLYPDGSEVANSSVITRTNPSTGTAVATIPGSYQGTTLTLWVEAAVSQTKHVETELVQIGGGTPDVHKVSIKIPANNTSYPIEYNLMQDGDVVGTLYRRQNPPA